MRILSLFLFFISTGPFMASPCNDPSSITEITLARSTNMGFTDGYLVTLRKDEKAIYSGSRFIERKGKYIGKIKEKDYKRIVKMMNDLGYFQLEDWYPLPNPKIIVNADTVTTSAVCKKTSKSVTHYERGGGSVVLESLSKEELRAIKKSENGRKRHEEIVKAIDDIIAQISWKKV